MAGQTVKGQLLTRVSMRGGRVAWAWTRRRKRVSGRRREEEAIVMEIGGFGFVLFGLCERYEGVLIDVKTREGVYMTVDAFFANWWKGYGRDFE